ncbi:DUF4012 domain-containing protein, partial [Candidatus Uhrbacteria bacterium]|nr:DUF4012 domain-containing protein [Candidatus Uhrbacteria bacterium]
MSGEQDYQHDRQFEPPNFLTCPAVPELPAPEEHEALPPAPPPPPQYPILNTKHPDPKHPDPNPPKRRSFLTWSIVLILIVTILSLLAPLMYGTTRATLAVKRAKSSVTAAQEKMTQRDFIGAEQEIDKTAIALQEIRAGLEATGFWENIPFVHRQLVVLEDTARAAETALVGIKEVVSVVATVQNAISLAGKTDQLLETGIAPERSFRDLSTEEKRLVLARFYEVLPELYAARERFTIAFEAWARIPQDDLYGPIRERLKSFAKLLPDLHQRMDQTIALLDVFLPMAGYPQEKNYLILLQNADEMRATGGFIGNVGTATIEAADIKQIQFQDVYAVDNPVSGVWKEPAPEPLVRELGVKALFLRDANWSPDFPQSAEKIMNFYERELTLASVKHKPLNGVMALNPGFFHELLKLTGPIVVDGKEFNADNFFSQLEYDVEIGFLHQGKAVDERKQIVSKLGDQIMHRLMDQPSSKWPDLLDLFTQALDRKDILLYERDPRLLALFDEHKWSGRTQPSVPDFLWVIDTNLAALKTDGVMEKDVKYSIQSNAPGGPTATVVLDYHNANRAITWRYTRYRDYVRVYVPEGSELISVEGAKGKIDVMRELGKTVFGAFWVIEPGDRRKLRFTYRLSPAVARALKQGSYGFYAQKQPGAHQRLTLDLLLGKKLSSAEPPERPEEWGDDRYRTTVPLDIDREFYLSF